MPEERSPADTPPSKPARVDISDAKIPLPKSRVESLSDLVFGLALSVGSVVLIQSVPQTVGEVVGDVEVFGLSFLILISLWLAYTRAMSSLREETMPSLGLNAALLFTVAIEPYLLYLSLGASGTSAIPPGVQNAASQFFAIDIAVALFIIAFFHAIAARDQLAAARFGRVVGHGKSIAFQMTIGIIFLISAAPICGTVHFEGTSLRQWLWLSVLLLRLPSAAFDRVVKRRGISVDVADLPGRRSSAERPSGAPSTPDALP